MENVAYASDLQVDSQRWFQERKNGLMDGVKYAKKFYGLECNVLIKTTGLDHKSG